MSGLYLTISSSIQSLWALGWAHPTVPVYWRANDADPEPDPSTIAHFLRNEVDFGRERLMAFGGGRFANERSQFGSVLITVWAARDVGSENTALDLMADATAIFRSVRSGDLSFIGEGSGFMSGPDETGNWFVRSFLTVFEYRFTG